MGTENQAPAYGEICWLEIPISDAPRASNFYATLFGWEVSPTGTPIEQPGVQAMFMFSTKQKKLNGGLLHMKEGYEMTRYGKLDKEVLPPLPTFCVEDCDKTLAQAKELGGRTHCPKTEIGGEMGYYARFWDTEGNIIGIWSSN